MRSFSRKFFTIIATVGILVGGGALIALMGALRPDIDAQEPEITPPTVFYETARAQSVTLDVVTQGEVRPRTDISLTAQVSGRVASTSDAFVDGGAFALGGQLEARLPQANRVSFSAYGYYAPSITAFADFDGYAEIGGDIGYEVIRGGSIYIGGRYVRHDYDVGGKDTVDNGMHIGLRLKF